MSIDNSNEVSFIHKWNATCDAANAVINNIFDHAEAGIPQQFTVTLTGPELVRVFGSIKRDIEADFVAVELASQFDNGEVFHDAAHHLFALVGIVDTLVSQAQDVPDNVPDSWS